MPMATIKRDKVMELKIENEKLRKKIAEAEKKVKETLGQEIKLEEMHQNMQSLTQQLADAQTENSQLQEMNSSYPSKFQDLHASIRNMEDTVKNLNLLIS